MKKSLLFVFLVVLFLGSIVSCKKNSDSGNNGTPRNVKYEITGNYTGHLLLIINDNVNGNESVTVTSLPWTKEKTYAGNVMGIGLGGNSVQAQPGQAGQVVTVKLYSGGALVRTISATCDANKILNIPTLTYIF